jgi:hypothetical protein
MTKIKKMPAAAAILLASLVMGACKLEVKLPEAVNYYPEKKAYLFYAYDNTEPHGRGSFRNYYEIAAVRLWEGTKCEVWVDRTIEVPESTARAMADTFDNKIYGDNTRTFGSYESIFEDPSSVKLVFLILDIRDNYSKDGNRGFIAGYFDPTDLSDLKYSNGAILYIDANPNDINSDLTYSTMAHEFQHLINYCYTLEKHRDHQMDTWIDEGLSSAAEYMYLGEIDASQNSRLDHFNKDPLGTIAKGNNFFIWSEERDEGSDTDLDDYATAYLFFQWLRIQSGSTSGNDYRIYKAIAQSEKYDYRAVTEAAAAHFGGGDAARFGDWETLLGTWLSANYLSSTAGRDGYKGEIKPRVWAVPGGGYTLYPGGAVYSKYSGNRPAGSADIKYLPMTRTSGESNNQYPAGDTRRLVMFNVITDVYDRDGSFREDTKKTGNLPGTGEAKPAASLSARSALSGPYPVDVRMVRGRGPGRQPVVLPAAGAAGETAADPSLREKALRLKALRPEPRD